MPDGQRKGSDFTMGGVGPAWLKGDTISVSQRLSINSPSKLMLFINARYTFILVRDSNWSTAGQPRI